jgi:hypothetical protein
VKLPLKELLLTVGAAFQYKLMSLASDLGKAIGAGLTHMLSPSTHPAGTPLPALDPHAWDHLSPAARHAFYARPEPGAEALSAHGGYLHVHGNLVVHVDKAPAADTEKLIADLRRAVRSSGPSTGAAGTESVATHGYPLSGR